MEWLAGILAAISSLPIIGKIVEAFINLLVKLGDIITLLPDILKAIPMKLWDLLVDVVKWCLGVLDRVLVAPIEKLIISPLDRLYERLFRIMDLAIDLLEKEFILIGKILEKKVDDYINGKVEGRSDLPWHLKVVKNGGSTLVKTGEWFGSKKEWVQRKHKKIMDRIERRKAKFMNKK